MEQSKQFNALSMPFRKTRWRFLALALAALILFGNNYSFDNPQALQTQIEEELDISIAQFNLLYSIFSLPNIFLTVLGGMIIDKLGVQFGVFTFSLAVTIAQIIIAIGGSTKTYTLMLIGRAIFGIASENLIISQSTFVSLWFKGKELATAMGIIMTVPEIGSALNSFLSPLLYEQSQKLSVPLFTSVGFCIFSFICAIALVYIDRYANKVDSQNQQLLMLSTDDEEEEEEVKEELSFKDIKKLSGTFWILLLICTLCLCAYIPFLDNVNEFCQQRFNFTPVIAGRAIVMTYLTPTIISPFIGILIDKTGMRRRWMIFTTLLFIITHLLFATISTPSNGNPQYAGLVPLCMLGISFTFYSCVIIPSIQYVVDQRIMGTAFGLLGVMESVGQCIFPLVAASIYETYDNYQQVAFFYMGIGILALLFAISLYFIDKKGSEILDALNPTEEMAKLAGMNDEITNASDTSEEDMELTEQSSNTSSQSNINRSGSPTKEKKISLKQNNKSEVPVFEIKR